MELMSKTDRHGRNELLMEYIQYQAHLPHPDLRQDQLYKKSAGSVDDEVGNIMRTSNGEGKQSLYFSSLVMWIHEKIIDLNFETLIRVIDEKLCLYFGLS